LNNKRKISIINKPLTKQYINVTIYCRVSTSHPKQLESLSNQIEYYKDIVKSNIKWKLVDIYIDIKSGKNTNRKEFQRMLDDCINKKIDFIITKSISRFGRNTADTLAVIHKLKLLNIDIFFQVENIRTSETNKSFLLSIFEAVDQAESETRSKNIKWGIKHGLENGTSKLYNRKCYGYYNSPDNDILINESEAAIVKKIFNLYLSGYSIIAIVRELENEHITSPTGKDKWPKRTIDTILSNEKYIGNVVVGKTYCNDFPYNERKINAGMTPKYLVENNHHSIIHKEIFNQVQSEKLRRSNIKIDGTVSKRKSTHYSMKYCKFDNDK